MQVAELAKDNKKIAAIDKAIGKDSFKVYISAGVLSHRISCITLKLRSWQAAPAASLSTWLKQSNRFALTSLNRSSNGVSELVWMYGYRASRVFDLVKSIEICYGSSSVV